MGGCGGWVGYGDGWVGVGVCMVNGRAIILILPVSLSLTPVLCCKFYCSL